MDIKQYLDQDQKKDLLRLLTAGSVDDGKSTLIGRLLFDSKKLYEDHLQALERDSRREGHAGGEIDYALLLDGLKAEREQGITIDVAYRYFSTSRRKFIIADTPGHEQYTRNMITGGSTANLAILLVDARKGVITQTRRHSFLVSLLGIKHVVVAVNKMDLVDYSQEIFDRICMDYHGFVTRLDIPDIHFIPLSALKGDNVVAISQNMPWYHGKSLLEFLETIHVTSDLNFEDLRYPVQYVIRPDLQYRGFAGTPASGIINNGDEVMALPSRKKTKVTGIIYHPSGGLGEMSPSGDLEFYPPQSISITLADEIDISRGDMLVHPGNLPRIGRSFEAMLVWMDETPMAPYTQYYIKHTSNQTRARIEQIRYRIDVNTLEHFKTDFFTLNEIGQVVITTVKPLFFDPYKKNHATGSFILIDPVTNNTVAVGMIQDVRPEEVPGTRFEITDKFQEVQKLQGSEVQESGIQNVEPATRHLLSGTEQIVNGISLISPAEREKRLRQKGVTVWITGLHGCGKNELAYGTERRLFDLGVTTVLLDGKSVRSGLSRELDFSPADRAEHMRRVAHICKLLNDQGIITICSFISPDEQIRQQVSEIIGRKRFYLIYLKSTLEFARKNDKYGLYTLADEGKVAHLPGVDAEYQVPDNPAILLEAEIPDDKTDKIVQFLKQEHVLF